MFSTEQHRPGTFTPGGGNCDKRAFTFAAIQVNLSAENESHP
jgi:hypothetical protein